MNLMPAIAEAPDPSQCVRPQITICSRHDDTMVRHITDWLGALLDVEFRWQRTLDNAGLVHIEYAESPRLPGAIWIPRRHYDAASPPPVVPDEARVTDPRRFHFDLFSAIRFWMLDEAHTAIAAADLDAHQRLPYARSIFGRRDVPALPIVNLYVDQLRSVISRALSHAPRPLWPEGKRACVVLTHDVDDPLDPVTAEPGRRSKARALSRLFAPFARRNRPVAARAGQDRHWLFDEIMAAESRYGWRSTFFFASRHRAMPGAHPSLDVTYDIADARFRALFERMAQRGFEVALHASYNACDAPDTIEHERARLERTANTKVLGVRHHYWHLGRPPWKTLTAHGRAGLRYDASIAFNESPGFRVGIALPFAPWNPTENRSVGVCQIPTMLMDGAIFYRPGATVDDGIQTASTWVDHLAAFGGAGAIDWHVRTSYPGSRRFRVWGEAYLGILDHLAERRDIWITTCAGLLRHMQTRGH